MAVCAASSGVGRRGGERRGLVLLAVIVVVTIAALTGTTAMYLAGAHMAAAGASLKKTQARALAWSGVQAAMAQMAEQREKLLDGQAPALAQEWELFTDGSGARGVVRLSAIGEGGAVSEAAKLEINTATVEMLAKVPGLDQTLAQAIVAARDKATFASVEDLLRVQGITTEKLRGGEADGEPDDTNSARDAASASRTPGLADLLTTTSFDPNVQAGLGQNGSDHRGKLRLNLHTAWSDRLGQAIDDRFGKGASAAVKGLMEKGTKFATLADVVNAARTAGLQPKDWGPVLDAFTVTDDPFLVGRVDVMRAPAAVLGAVPGISASAADQIVQARTKLDDDSRRSVSWVVAQGILTAEQFAQAVDHLGTRSMQWRVRVEAGMAARDESGGADRLSETPLSDRVVLEAVIDLSSERPRVAYLRDVTLLEAARGLAAEFAAAEPADAGRADDAAPQVVASAGPTGASGGATGATGSTGGDGSSRVNLDFSSGMDKGFGDLNLGGLNLGDTHPTDPIQSGSTSPDAAEQAGPPAPSPDDAGASGGGGVDRRTGRWTTGKAKGGGS